MEVRTVKWISSCGTVLAVLLLQSIGVAAVSSSPPLSTAQVVERMVAMNRARAEALRSYTATCVYHVESGSDRSADLVVKIAYLWPNRKESTIISWSGSSALRNYVLNRLRESELEAMQEENRRRTDMNPENYDFTLVGIEETGPHKFYVMEVVPKIKNKFLFRGRIWVDARDFGITRMEGAPAKNPSWWTTHIEVDHSYSKVGDFWLPARIESVAQVRMFGRSVLTIIYKDYKLIEAHSVETPTLASALPLGTRVTKN
jgi:outer membrane lipoprotein-sorting protein